MLFFKNQRNLQSGFTLIEILIVLVLLGILAATAVTKYIDMQEEAQAKVCAYTRGALASDLNIARVYDPSKTLQQLFSAEIASRSIVCPAEGTLGIQVAADDSFKITCSIHDPSGANSFADPESMQSVIDAMKKYTNIQTDSGAVDISTSQAAQVKADLAALGINLEDMGAKSWQYNRNEGMLYWTPVDINTLSVGDKTPVMRYNTKSGTYTVWIATVGSGTTDSSPDTPYNVLRPTSGGVNYSAYAPSTNQDKTAQTYENALKYFNEASAKK